MSITKDVPVPTSYRHLHESKTIFNIHDRLMFVWIIHIIVCGFTLIGMRNFGISNLIFYLLAILIVVVILLIVAKDVKTLDRNKMHLLLIFRILRKKHIMKKYVEPLDDIKKYLNINTVEDSGLIYHTDGTSSTIVQYIPPRTPDSEIDNYTTNMKNLINSLYGGFSFQFISNSVLDTKNPLTEATSTAMKNKDTSPPITKILHSLYEESKEKKENIEWEFTLIVTMPATKTIEKAEQMKTAFLSGLHKSFARAGVVSMSVNDRTETIVLLRSHLC